MLLLLKGVDYFVMYRVLCVRTDMCLSVNIFGFIPGFGTLYFLADVVLVQYAPWQRV